MCCKEGITCTRLKTVTNHNDSSNMQLRFMYKSLLMLHKQQLFKGGMDPRYSWGVCTYCEMIDIRSIDQLPFPKVCHFCPGHVSSVLQRHFDSVHTWLWIRIAWQIACVLILTTSRKISLLRHAIALIDANDEKCMVWELDFVGGGTESDKSRSSFLSCMGTRKQRGQILTRHW